MQLLISPSTNSLSLTYSFRPRFNILFAYSITFIWILNLICPLVSLN